MANPTPQKQKKISKKLTYISLAIGLTLLIIGVYVGSYTIKVTVDVDTSRYFGPPITTPQTVYLQPYQPIGIALIAIAVFILFVDIVATVVVSAVYQTYGNT